MAIRTRRRGRTFGRTSIDRNFHPCRNFHLPPTAPIRPPIEQNTHDGCEPAVALDAEEEQILISAHREGSRCTHSKGAVLVRAKKQYTARPAAHPVAEKRGLPPPPPVMGAREVGAPPGEQQPAVQLPTREQPVVGKRPWTERAWA